MMRPARTRQVGQRGIRHEKRAGQVVTQHFVPHSFGLFYRHLRAHRAVIPGVIYQDVDMPKTRHHRPDRRDNLFQYADIRALPGAVGPDRLGCGPQHFFSPPDDDHLVPVLDESLCHRAPDPSTPTGDDNRTRLVFFFNHRLSTYK